MELAMLCEMLNQMGLGMEFELVDGRIEFKVLGLLNTGNMCIFNSSEEEGKPFSVYLGEIPYLDWVKGEECLHTIIEHQDPTSVYVLLMLIGDEGWESITKRGGLQTLSENVEEVQVGS